VHARLSEPCYTDAEVAKAGIASVDGPLPAPGGFLRRHVGKLVASAIITFGIVYTVHKGGLKFLPEGGDFQRVRWWTLSLYLVVWLGMTWFRSVRWRYLLRSIADVSRKRLFAVSCIGFAAILLMPFRLGEIVRPYLIRTPTNQRERSGRAITLTAATSSVVAERIIDGLYLSVVLAVALVLVPTIHPLPSRVVGLPVTVAQVRWSGYAMLAVFAAAFATISIFYFARSWAHRTTLAVIGKVSTSLAESISSMCEKFADGLHVFGRGRDAIGFLFETSLYWGLNVLGMWLLAWGCGVVHADGSSPSFGEACALMGMLGCAILIPGPPGMLGVFQAGIYAGMTMFYPTSVVTGPGAAYVFLLYATQCVFTLVLGTAALAFERGDIRALEESDTMVRGTAGAAQ
jgi:uncharacterized protein (TIRG00374 family)